LLILAGVTLVALARREFATYSQPTDPGFPTKRIVKTGIFSLSRNPLYLGGICFLLGIALAANLPWMVILLLPALIVCHFVLIVPEERYLATRFGREYELYASIVHRWIGRRKSPPVE
jgi:protein-S-isoprenylcysteine O-methyltransferase Ste14